MKAAFGFMQASPLAMTCLGCSCQYHPAPLPLACSPSTCFPQCESLSHLCNASAAGHQPALTAAHHCWGPCVGQESRDESCSHQRAPPLHRAGQCMQLVLTNNNRPAPWPLGFVSKHGTSQQRQHLASSILCIQPTGLVYRSPHRRRCIARCNACCQATCSSQGGMTAHQVQVQLQPGWCMCQGTVSCQSHPALPASRPHMANLLQMYSLHQLCSRWLLCQCSCQHVPCSHLIMADRCLLQHAPASAEAAARGSTMQTSRCLSSNLCGTSAISGSSGRMVMPCPHAGSLFLNSLKRTAPIGASAIMSGSRRLVRSTRWLRSEARLLGQWWSLLSGSAFKHGPGQGHCHLSSRSWASKAVPENQLQCQRSM